jgi:dethiobiotin synthetase
VTRAFFITGTDTGVGKTLVAAGLLHAANERGWSTLGLKPVAAGGEPRGDAIVNRDARLLQATASVRLDYPAVNPVALTEAIAPHIAAAREGRTLTAAVLATHCREQLAANDAELAVVEGAGGWLVPLQGRETMANLAALLGLPVILVIGLKLGCLNHALLTSSAIRDAGLPLAGWAASCAGPPMTALQENLATLREWLPAPCIGVLPDLGPDAGPAAAAAYLRLSVLTGHAQ